MVKRNVKKIALDAYNLGVHDWNLIHKARSTESFDNWFENDYKRRGKSKLVSLRVIEETVFDCFGTSKHRVYNKRREEPWMYYRQLIQYLMWKHSKFNNKKIGSHTGGFHRTTILNSIKVIQDYYDVNSVIMNEIDEIEKQLKI